MISAVEVAPVPFKTSRIKLPGGVRINLVDGGPSDRPAVVMLHGLGDSSFSFSRVMPLLTNDYRVVAIDQRGHGDSDRPDSDYSIDHFATDALQVMESLDLSAATLLGHSMGSFVARRVAERDPHRVTRLVLVGTALTPRNAVIAELMTAVDALEDPVSDAFIREFQLSCIHRPVPDDFMARVIEESRKVPARVWRSALAGLWSFRAQWPITVPTFILGGEKDRVFGRSEHNALFRSIQRSVLHLEPEVGHTIHWEAPERFVELAFDDTTDV